MPFISYKCHCDRSYNTSGFCHMCNQNRQIEINSEILQRVLNPRFEIESFSNRVCKNFQQLESDITRSATAAMIPLYRDYSIAVEQKLPLKIVGKIEQTLEELAMREEMIRKEGLPRRILSKEESKYLKQCMIDAEALEIQDDIDRLLSMSLKIGILNISNSCIAEPDKQTLQKKKAKKHKMQKEKMQAEEQAKQNDANEHHTDANQVANQETVQGGIENA